MSGQEAGRAFSARDANQPIAGFFSENIFRKKAGNRLFLARLPSKKSRGSAQPGKVGLLALSFRDADRPDVQLASV